MNQIENIKHMEQNLDEATAAVKALEEALDKYAAAQKGIQELDAYYGSKEWRKDYDDDAAGRLPQDLKRGVLSEDGIYNLLADNRELFCKMQEMCTEKVRNL